MKDRDVIRANERYRTISRTLFQLAAALVGAATVRIYSAGNVTLETAAWILSAIALMWVGLKVLDLLDSEDM